MPTLNISNVKWKSKKKYSHALACAYLEYKCCKEISKYGETSDESEARMKGADFTNDTIEQLRRMLLCPEWQTSVEDLKKFKISSDIKVVAREVKQMLDHYGEDLILIKENQESIKLCQSNDKKSMPNGSIRGAGAVKREIGLNITEELFYLWFGGDNKKYIEIGPDFNTFAQTWGSNVFGEITEDNKTTLGILIEMCRHDQANTLLSMHINKIQEPGILDDGNVHSKNIEVTLNHGVPIISNLLCYFYSLGIQKKRNDSAISQLISINNELLIAHPIVREINNIRIKALKLKIEIDANIEKLDKLEGQSKTYTKLLSKIEKKRAEHAAMLTKMNEREGDSEYAKEYLNNLNSCKTHRVNLELIKPVKHNCLLCISRIMQFRATFDLLELSACGTRKSPDNATINVLQFAYILGGEELLVLLISNIKDEHITDTQDNPDVYRNKKKDEVIESVSEIKKTYGADKINKLQTNIWQLIANVEDPPLNSAPRTSSGASHNEEHNIAIPPELPPSGSPTHLKNVNDEAAHKSEKLRKSRPSQPPPPKPDIESELAETESHGKVDVNSNTSSLSKTQLTSCVVYLKLKSTGSESSIMTDDQKQDKKSTTDNSTSLPGKTDADFSESCQYLYKRVVFWSLSCISFACLMIANAVEMLTLCEPQPNLYICKYIHHSLVKCTEIYNDTCKYLGVFSDFHLESPQCIFYLAPTLLLSSIGFLGSFLATINVISSYNIRDRVTQNEELLFRLKKESTPKPFIFESDSSISGKPHNQYPQNAHTNVF